MEAPSHEGPNVKVMQIAVTDRVIQQATAQILSQGYEKYFSENSYGFRPGRDCHMAVKKVLEYMKEGYE